MNKIKIGSIVRCDDWALVYHRRTGLVYNVRVVGGQQYPIATVAFDNEKQIREVSTEFLTLMGEIAPSCLGLKYTPGSRVEQDSVFDKDYIIDHIEIIPFLRKSKEDILFYNILVIDTNCNSRILYPDDKIYGNRVVEERYEDTINMYLSQITNGSQFYIDTDMEMTDKLIDDIVNTLKEEKTMCMSKSKPASANPIKKVIFNDPATIVFWKNGTKTVVKCQEGAMFDPEKGLAMAISRYYLCDICGLERYDGVFKRYMPKETKK